MKKNCNGWMKLSMLFFFLCIGTNCNNTRAGDSLHSGAGVFPEGCCPQPYLGQPGTALPCSGPAP